MNELYMTENLLNDAQKCGAVSEIGNISVSLFEGEERDLVPFEELGGA